MEEGLNQLPYKECTVTTPTGNQGCYSYIFIIKNQVELEGGWKESSKSVCTLRSLVGAVLLSNLINPETFSKEIYVNDFFLMACLSIQVKGQSVFFSMQVLPFWSHRDGVKNCWQLLSPSAGKLQALTNGWAALKLQVQG